ncbi:MAG TPA: glycosyltransferase, partial [Patescibacteria group bacterium]|nr:glycosyltransferase [Patescibacteria group bacterium]
FADWPGLPGWTWVVTDDGAGHPDLIAREAVDMTFTTILRSCDVVVSKPGYGTFAEVAVNGVPLLYLPRPGWPETPHLAGWLAEHGRCQAIEAKDLFSAEALQAQLQKLFSIPIKPLADPSGDEEAAQAILALLAKMGRIQV